MDLCEQWRVLPDGGLAIVDPTPDDLPLIRAVNPSYVIPTAPLLCEGMRPQFHWLRENGIRVSCSDLATCADDSLWRLHTVLMRLFLERQLHPPGRVRDAIERCLGTPHVPRDGEASLLDLKYEIASRMLRRCRLCAHRCDVDRTTGARGKCGLGDAARVAPPRTLIAEEPMVNPSRSIRLVGCGLRCAFCQQHPLLNPRAAGSVPLAELDWETVACPHARTLSFVGGNPDESLPAILAFLRRAPDMWSLPIVWNCHGYGTLETLALLDGVVDVYLPDWKYGSEQCGRTISRAPDYPAAARTTVAAMIAQRVPVIVRIVVLPGHVACCHLPTIEALAKLRGDFELDDAPEERLFVSVLGQYAPDYRITARDDALARRPTSDEVATVVAHARRCGLALAMSDAS